MKGIRVSMLSLAFVIVFLLSLVPSALAETTYGWTTTAEFDGGVKTQSGGNYEVETSTDNAGITSGQLELGSIKGDTFGLADTDADTFKWDVLTRATYLTNQYAITGGVLAMDISVPVGQGFRGPRTAFTFSGNFDVRVKVDEQSNSGGLNRYLYLNVFNAAVVECSDSGTVDGLLYFVNFAALNAPLALYACVNGVYGAQIGTNTNRPSDPVWLRLTRAGNVFIAYYSTDGIIWTLDETTTNANIGGNFYWQALCSIDGVGRCDVDLDDYTLSSGTVDAGGYRSSGAWTTNAVTFAGGESVHFINLTYASASANGYVTRTRLLRASDDAALFTDNTDLTSGTTHSYIVPYAAGLEVNWKVEVGLAGNGAATTALQAVAAWTTTALNVSFTVTPQTGDAPLPVDFAGSATGGVPPYNWTWDFGDSGVGYGRTPSHTYGAAGNFTVVLTVTDANGDVDTASGYVLVSEPPGCFGTSVFGAVLFTVFGIVAGMAILAALWAGVKSGSLELDTVEVASIVVSIVVLIFIVGAFMGIFQTGATLGC